MTPDDTTPAEATAAITRGQLIDAVASMTDTADVTPEARAAFVNFWSGVGPWIAGGHADAEDVAHEAFHTGWQAGAARAAAAQLERCSAGVPYMVDHQFHADGMRCRHRPASLLAAQDTPPTTTASSDGRHTT